MSFHYEATTDFQNSVVEVETLITLASSDDNNRPLFLKLAAVSLVTKFQVFVEKIFEEFRYQLNDKPSGTLPTYLKMNSLRLSIEAKNPLTGIVNHRNFTEEKKTKIIQYLNSISYISNNTAKVNNDFLFNTKFPLGKTGKGELIDLLKQIDGDDKPFVNFGTDKIDYLDSILATRHWIIHQDRFNGTETTVKNSLTFVKELVEYIDEYLNTKIQNMS